jgi:hypothetical protein
LYASPNVTNVIEWMRMQSMGNVRNAYKILVGKHEGKRLLGRRRFRWEDIIRMNLREIGWECVKWMHLTQNRDQCWLL